jgi:hypothetical protein
MGFRWGFGKSFDISPKKWVIQCETVLLQQPVPFLQAEEEERILLPVNHIITKKQCKGKDRATVVAML